MPNITRILCLCICLYLYIISSDETIQLGNISYLNVESHHRMFCEFDTVYFSSMGEKWEMNIMYCHNAI